MSCRAKDCMNTNIKSVHPDMNAKEALAFLLKSGVSGLLVIDSLGHLLGVFTEKEVLKSILPVYLKKIGSFAYAQDSKSELHKLQHLDSFLVKDIMRKEISTVSEDTCLSEVSHIMLSKSERRVAVTREGRPVGVITRSDVVTALAKEAGIAL